MPQLHSRSWTPGRRDIGFQPVRPSELNSAVSVPGLPPFSFAFGSVCFKPAAHTGHSPMFL
jgi:hypothetical protein